jgi:hypothetical protein
MMRKFSGIPGDSIYMCGVVKSAFNTNKGNKVYMPRRKR